MKFSKFAEELTTTEEESIQPDENGRLKIDCIPVVISYNFDSEQPVLLFSSEEAALKYIREDFENEKRIAVEENGDEIIEDETYFNEDEGYARLTTAAYPENCVTEWNIGSIY